MSRSANPFEFDGFDAPTDLFRRPVRPRHGQTGAGSGGSGDWRGSSRSVESYVRQVRRVVSKTPEVMVRITGGAKGRGHVNDHLAYITRNGKLEAIDEQGGRILGRASVRELATAWMDGAPKEGARRAPDTRNLMLSMPPGHDPELVLRAVRSFADKTFGDERQYVMVLHTDQRHPHVHLTLKTRGFDGRNLHPRKADLQAWREGFAHELRQLGIAAEATPRRSRGVVRKPKSQAVLHMERDYRAGKKERAPATQLAKYAEAVQEITGGKPPKVRPWELRIVDRQVKVRGAWLKTAAVLDKHPSEDARKLAGQIRAFVADMPPVQTERQAIVHQVDKRPHRRDRDQDRG